MGVLCCSVTRTDCTPCLREADSPSPSTSAELAKLLGTKKGEQLSRPEVVKRLWAYLKENKLQDPTNKQYFTPDKAMSPSSARRRSGLRHVEVPEEAPHQCLGK